VQQTPDQPNPEEPAHRRQPTLKMATLAFQNMLASSQVEDRRSGRKDLISEIMLPLSSILLICAICFSGDPMLKALTFLAPLAATAYYLYRRFGVIATFDSRQAYITWRLLTATFLFGGTFALFCVYGMGYLLVATKH
jgi:hypothetical protein